MDGTERLQTQPDEEGEEIVGLRLVGGRAGHRSSPCASGPTLA